MKTYFDIEGDGGSNVLGQVLGQREQAANNLRNVRHRLAVGSGKGGVGKSTLTFQLASALRRRGLEIAVLDADLNGPSQARLAGMRVAPPLPGTDGGIALPRTREGIGVVSLGSFLADAEALDFDSVADGDSHTWRATREATLLGELLRSVEWGTLDVLLFDLPPGAERTFQLAEMLGADTALLLVTQPSALAREVLARTLDALAGTANPILGIAENMSGYACEACGDIRPLFPDREADSTGDAGASKGPSVLGTIPFDPRLAALSDRGAADLDHAQQLTRERLDGLAENVLAALHHAHPIAPRSELATES